MTFHNELCDCESMGGRMGSHRDQCPTMKARRLDQLEADLATHKDEKAKKCAKRLLKLGYRMPDCPERWQQERMIGALLGVSLIAESGRQMAEYLINTVKLEVP